MSKLCAYCKQPSAYTCALCNIVRYCSEACALTHWPLHALPCVQFCGPPGVRPAPMVTIPWDYSGFEHLMTQLPNVQQLSIAAPPNLAALPNVATPPNIQNPNVAAPPNIQNPNVAAPPNIQNPNVAASPNVVPTITRNPISPPKRQPMKNASPQQRPMGNGSPQQRPMGNGSPQQRQMGNGSPQQRPMANVSAAGPTNPSLPPVAAVAVPPQSREWEESEQLSSTEFTKVLVIVNDGRELCANKLSNGQMILTVHQHLTEAAPQLAG